MKRLLIVAALILFIASTSSASFLKYYNCTPNTQLGGVIWNSDKTDYELMPSLRFDSDGTKTIDVEPGTYAITHYRPAKMMFDAYGNVKGMRPAAILEYMDDIVVNENETVTLEFGCE